MLGTPKAFQTHLFAFEQAELAMHRNLMPCVIFGRCAPVLVTDGTNTAHADIVCIKPDTPHRVSINEGGADILYFDGVQMPDEQAVFTFIEPRFSDIVDAVKAADAATIRAFREELSVTVVEPDPAVLEIAYQLYKAPIKRLSQDELAQLLGLERTQALRHFKWNTGLTFRKFKIWAASIATVRSVLSGQTIGTAGIDSGFSDAAHVARTARAIFGVTPTTGIGSLTKFISV